MSNDTKHLIKRNNCYHLKRRVPKRYSHVEDRDTIWVALKTDSLREAGEKAVGIWKQQIAGWEAEMAGKQGVADKHFEAISELAQIKGYHYLPAQKVSVLPIDELLQRIEAIPVRYGIPDEAQAAALLGGSELPKLTVSQTLEVYWDLARDKILNKSPDQKRRWKAPRIKAVQNFINLLGDKELDKINREDAVAFRNWWLDRIENENLTPNSANKDLIHIKSVLETVNDLKKLDLTLPFSGLTLKEGHRPARPAFSSEWIEQRLLADGALDGMNLEARIIFLVMINTGARPSEIANLTNEKIQLDCDYPHILIRSEQDREIKSDNSERVIPLTGCSLDAMQLSPNGFPRYRDNPSLSATINSYLSDNGLRETPKHSAYSLRHSFEYRLRRAKVDDRLRAELFGHSYDREKYGGPTLDELTEAIQLVSF